MVLRILKKWQIRNDLLLALTGAASVVVPLGLGLIEGPESLAQPAVAGSARPSFEAASIKPSKPGTFPNMGFPRGEFSATGAPLWALITLAYDIHTSFQVLGAPPWSKSEPYDVLAKAEGDPSRDVRLLMLQTLLEERFRLKCHWETKQLPVYALVASKQTKLHKSEGECQSATTTAPPPLKPGEMPRSCGNIIMFPGRLSGQKVSIAQLTNVLSTLTYRPVVDKTGLSEKYDLYLEWAPLPGQFDPPPGPRPPGLPPEALTPADPEGPPLSTALQQQLGLRLRAGRGPVRVLVIDYVERPSAN